MKSLRRTWAYCEMPPPRKASSYQKKPASSQARPTRSTWSKVAKAPAGSSIRAIPSPTSRCTASTVSTSRSMGAPIQPWTLNAG